MTKLEEKMNDSHAKLQLENHFKSVLRTLCDDMWSIKQIALQISKDNERYELAQKAANYWEKDVYPKLNILESKILEWNRKHPDNKLPRVEEICGFKIRKSVITER